jgi:hypothetical protein
MSGRTGFDASQFVKGLNDARRRQIEAARNALDLFGEHVVGDAQQLTPVLTGFLAGSGTTTPAVIDGEQITKEIGFNADYAAAVHERLSAHHDQGQAKYLETALQRNSAKLGPFVASRVDAVRE